MNKIEHMHLMAILKAEYETEENALHHYPVAQECSKVTEQIAIEFAIWLNKTDEIAEKTKHIDFTKSDSVNLVILSNSFNKRPNGM